MKEKKKKKHKQVRNRQPTGSQFAIVLSLLLGEKEQTPPRVHPCRNVTFVLFGVLLVEK